MSLKRKVFRLAPLPSPLHSPLKPGTIMRSSGTTMTRVMQRMIDLVFVLSGIMLYSQALGYIYDEENKISFPSRVGVKRYFMR